MKSNEQSGAYDHYSLVVDLRFPAPILVSGRSSSLSGFRSDRMALDVLQNKYNMTAAFIHHETDELSEVRVKDHGHLYRKDDVVVLRQQFYLVEDCQYDIDEDVATYWLGVGVSEHPNNRS